MLRATDPSTGRLLWEVPVDSESVIEQKLSAADAAFRQWRTTSFAQRAELLNQVADHLRKQEERLAPLMTREMGKPIREARGEVGKAAWCAEHYAQHAEQYLTDEVIGSDATRSWVQHLPLGPVLGILPWNAPFWLAFRFCAPALMAGNPCLIKHDPHTPACAVAIAEAFEEVGFPPGVLQALLIETPTVEGVIRDSRIRAVSFTGSTRGGQAVGTIAASEIKPAVLELGGSDPCLVLADADLEQAADAASLSRIINAGQSCIAAKRLLVEEAVHDSFVALLQARLETLKVGNPDDPETDVGPLARVDLRENLHRQVEETKARGAECSLGGELSGGEGFFYPVTLLTGVTPEMPAFCEETFGPVAVVTRVRDADEALALANQTEYGLAASVWSTPERGVELARQIEAGQVAVNGVVKTDPRLPSGGIKRSGYGRELGPHGIREFVNHQQVWVGPKRDV